MNRAATPQGRRRGARDIAAGASLAFALVLSLLLGAALAAEEPPPVGDYVFDDIPRARSKGKTASCPKVELVEYRGSHVPLDRPVEIDRRFVPHLRNFEAVLVEAGLEVYGRAPARIVHRGGYRCRSVTGRKGRWSEHAFGNALDTVGFDFAPAAAHEAGEVLPAELTGPFEVRVGEHWRAKEGVGALHARFLHTVVRLLIERRVFRIILGPGDPGHEEVLHVDYGPSWYVRVDLPQDDVAP